MPGKGKVFLSKGENMHDMKLELMNEVKGITQCKEYSNVCCISYYTNFVAVFFIGVMGKFSHCIDDDIPK